MRPSNDVPVRLWNLAQMAKSPAHYLYSLNAPDEPTTGMERGTAVHTLVLGKGKPVIAYPGKQRRGKEWEAFADQHTDKQILTGAEYSKARRMADSVLANADAVAVLKGQREETLYWKLLGRTCRGTPDAYLKGGHVTDLKTCPDASPGKFPFKAVRMGYAAQLSFYLTGVEVLFGDRPDAYIVAVEANPPYVCQVFKLTKNALETGTKQWRLWFERLLQCEAANHFPGYCESIVELDTATDEFHLDFGDESATEVETEAA